MTRTSRTVLAVLAVAAFAWVAAVAVARWRRVGLRRTSIAFNQGVAFDAARANFFLDGVSSPTNSGLYRTNSRLRLTAANYSVIPKTKEGYNHAGDLSFDRIRDRILLPLECYYPNAGGNTCGTGAIGVADPVTLRMRYYVNLARSQIQKAMWDEISPDGRWVWTSSGTNLLVYRATAINKATALRQRSGGGSGVAGRDLGSVLPTSAVTGAAFYRDRRGTLRLLLSLNLGTRFEIVSFRTTTTSNGLPKLLGAHPSTIVTIAHSSLDNEPEGVAATPRRKGTYPLGGPLHWQILPKLTQSTLFSRIFTFAPSPTNSRFDSDPLRPRSGPILRNWGVSLGRTPMRRPIFTSASW